MLTGGRRGREGGWMGARDGRRVDSVSVWESSSLTQVFLHHKSNNCKNEGVNFSSSLEPNCKSLELGFSIKIPFKSPLGFVNKTNGNFISIITTF